MTALSIRHTFRKSLSLFAAWVQRRHDERILAGLSGYQLKDIGYRRPE
jgi:uncharacterized protein YjiS (DUF1127 family)